MIEPVVDALGNTYDKEAIQNWFQTSNEDPLTLEEVKDQSLKEDDKLKREIIEYKEEKIKKGLVILPKLLK